MDETDKEFYYIKSLDGKRKPTSTDYYSVAILHGAYVFIHCRMSHQDGKSLKPETDIVQPVKHKILIGKVMDA